MISNKRILIAGGSGMVGRELIKHLTNFGVEVSILSRIVRESDDNIKSYVWDPEKGSVDEQAILDNDILINLAGANIGAKKWSDERKKEIVASRTQTTKLLVDKAKELDKKFENVICASAIGIYGGHFHNKVYNEESPAGNDFLADVVKAWEKSSNEFKEVSNHLVILRFGVVLDLEGGALPKMMKPITLGVGSALGTGKQYLSWIHIDDLCRMILWCLNKNLEGVYNAVAPNPLSNNQFTKVLAKSLNKPLLLPNVPSFVLKLMLGKMSALVLEGQNVSSDKVMETGFDFKFGELHDALNDLLPSGK
ncbi:TIGR01777 family oxidoreductase [Aureibacter tunicatorum]|uniref:TIGR01777 family protein n=1 Tax=Aureibacter tunicatorum TaxID=866807 RepID=A0AAE4BNU6_9BACT|nr:TIGR01777 family oxidoreductase [Aureibacter tunicatorum]MDR6237219.1 hypothetical protein [Aureibacter tunicatorum]BDD06211.1 NAD-dependent epimerase [Aureibacter tunicatorum]